MSAAKEFEQANKEYVSSFSKGDLTLPPSRQVVVITCMDARINPYPALGLKEGDAHVSVIS
jgi:carbonic anhydrase